MMMKRWQHDRQLHGVWMVEGCRGLQVLYTIALKNHDLGLQVLNRKAKNVKLNGAVIVTSKLSNR